MVWLKHGAWVLKEGRRKGTVYWIRSDRKQMSPISGFGEKVRRDRQFYPFYSSFMPLSVLKERCALLLAITFFCEMGCIPPFHHIAPLSLFLFARPWFCSVQLILSGNEHNDSLQGYAKWVLKEWGSGVKREGRIERFLLVFFCCCCCLSSLVWLLNYKYYSNNT